MRQRSDIAKLALLSVPKPGREFRRRNASSPNDEEEKKYKKKNSRPFGEQADGTRKDQSGGPSADGREASMA